MENYSFFAVLASALLAVLIMAIPQFIRTKRKNDCIIRNFRGGGGIADFFCYLWQEIFNENLVRLHIVNTSDPKLRPRDEYDFWFKKQVEAFALDGWCLGYINSKGHLTDTFFKYIHEPEKNLKFQRLITSIFKNRTLGVYQENFSNLLYSFSEKWELLPEVLDTLNNDKRFAAVKNIYERGRENAVVT